MTYRLRIHKRAEQFLQRCPKHLERRIRSKLALLKEDPFAYLVHFERKDVYKLRIGNYRALVDVEDDVVSVQYIDHRKRIYKRSR
jgi:mRNA interferase RelE/StbE